MLPFDLADSALREDVWERWLAQDPVRMLDDHLDALAGLRAISLECGRQDEFNLYVGTSMLHRRLEAAGIKHRFELFDGGHGGITHRYGPAYRLAGSPPGIARSASVFVLTMDRCASL